MRAVGVSLALLGGCNALFGIDEPILAAVDAAPGGPGDVIVTATETRHLEDGRVMLGGGFDVVGADVTVSPGVVGRHPAISTGSDSFRIEGIPAGATYTLVIDARTSVVTSARTVDVGRDLPGRSIELKDTASALVFDLVNLTAPAPGDSIYAYLANYGGTYFSTTLGSGPALSWRQELEMRALSGAKGDRVTVAHFSPVNLASGTFNVIADSYAVPPFELLPGDTNLNGSFSVPSRTRTASIDFRRSGFHAFTGIAGPPQAPTEDWGVDFYYWWDAPSLYGAFWFPIPVASLHVTAAGATDLDFGPLQYRDPLPDTWSRYYVARHIAGFALPLGDGSSYSSQFVNNFTASTTGGVLAPLVGPVGDFAIGGTDAFQPHLGLTAAPRITWSPPSVGTANRYVVRVVDAASGFVALCVVPAAAALELTLRDDILQPGHDYFLVVTALATTGNPETAPFRTTFPLGSADAISAVVTRAP